MSVSGPDADGDGEVDDYVQCERCEQWRHAPAAELARIGDTAWFCEFNTWDGFNSCNVAEARPQSQADSPLDAVDLSSAQVGGGGNVCFFCRAPALAGNDLIGSDAEYSDGVPVRVHERCALFSGGTLEASHRGYVLNGIANVPIGMCLHCGKDGAHVPCQFPKCTRIFHLLCVDVARSRVEWSDFSIMCSSHATAERIISSDLVQSMRDRIAVHAEEEASVAVRRAEKVKEYQKLVGRRLKNKVEAGEPQTTGSLHALKEFDPALIGSLMGTKPKPDRITVPYNPAEWDASGRQVAKTCTRCFVSKPMDADHFHRSHKVSCGFKSICKLCSQTGRRRRRKKAIEDFYSAVGAAAAEEDSEGGEQ